MQQAEDDTGIVFGRACLSRRVQDGVGDDAAVGFGNLILGQFAGYDLFDLVLEAQGDYGDIFGVDGRGMAVFAAGAGET
jgi:hypothetical protein